MLTGGSKLIIDKAEIGSWKGTDRNRGCVHGMGEGLPFYSSVEGAWEYGMGSSCEGTCRS